MAPTGEGGVAVAVDAVVPHLPRATRIGVRPWVAALGRVRRGAQDEVVHVFPSVRSRALVRDSLLAALARRRGAPLVVHVHGWDPRAADAARWVARLGGAARVRAMVSVLCPAHADALAAWGVPPERIALGVNPCDPARIAPPRLRDPADVPVIAVVGRLVAGKRVDRVIDAVAALVAGGVDARLVVAGDGPLRNALEARAAPLGARATFLGWCDAAALQRVYGSATLLVSASEAEVYPLAVVEALASGVPVVTTDVGAAAALVGDAGIVVPPDAAADVLAEAVHAALAAPPDPRVRAQWARATHDPAAVAAHWVALSVRARALTA